VALNSEEVRLAPNGKLLRAPLGTTPPADVTAAWPVGWQDLGYASEEGVEFSPTVELNRIPAWQSATPVRIAVSGAQLTIGFSLLQWNAMTTEMFFGALWEEVGGVGRMGIKSSPDLNEQMLGLEWSEGELVNRFYCERGLITDRESLSINRTDATASGVTFEALDLNGYMGWLLSNDPAVLEILQS
jgi:hypothetical protein